MKRIYLIFIISIILCPLLSGCWGKRELNDIGIAVAMGIDKKKDGYVISIQIVNPGAISAQGGSSNRSPVTTYSFKSKTIFEAIRRLTKETPRKIYFAHLRMVIISEPLARKEGLSDVLEFLIRDPEIRKDFYVLISKNYSAKQILSILSPIEKIPANKLFRSLEMSEKYWAPTLAVPLDTLVRDIAKQGKDPVVTGVTIKGNAKKGEDPKNTEKAVPYAILSLTSLAVFKGDKLVGWLNESESKGYNYAAGNMQSTVGPITWSKREPLIVEISGVDAKMKTKMKNGKPTFSIHVKVEANVAEVRRKIDLTKPGMVKKLENGTSKTIHGRIKAVVTASKQKKADILGLGNLVYQSHPKEWKRMQKDWQKDILPNVPVDIQVETKIKRTGTVIQSPLKRFQ
ncbi:Ger(x)C family spore germination protein [Microbacteriaceae bacterium 4G12]